MSVIALVEGLKQGDANDDHFLKELRTGLNTILDGMQDVRARRADEMGELEQRLRDGGQLSLSKVLVENKALTEERVVLQNELNAWRLQARNSAHQDACHSLTLTQIYADFQHQTRATGGLSKKRKNALTKIINAAISRSKDANTRIQSRAVEMIEEGQESAKIVPGLKLMEQMSVSLKQSLNNRVDMVNENGNAAAAQDLKNAMRRWGDIHRSLVAERETATKSEAKHKGRARKDFSEDHAFIREQTDELRSIAEKLGLDMKRIDG